MRIGERVKHLDNGLSINVAVEICPKEVKNSLPSQIKALDLLVVQEPFFRILETIYDHASWNIYDWIEWNKKWS